MRSTFSIVCMVITITVACTNRKIKEIAHVDSAIVVLRADSVNTNVNNSIVLTDLPLIDSTLIVVDTVTGLVWMKYDFSYQEGRFLSVWEEIFEWKSKMNELKYAGFDDWRVPTIKEYRTINKNSTDRKQYAIKFNEIDSISAWGDGAYAFWSATTPNKYTASYMSFIEGFATSGHREKQMGYGKLKGELGMSVRLVREGNVNL
ncbi:DUF1566 domain-containing protein [Fulvivirga sp. 29W222]|uniref:DUF1566 domain-containing protein n=1 Tax=Fulvivirga marina TaxID=2494733 RepID=A0A937FWJ2_9BACT|nr:DUF1566 domain-containing protein [Fulvivirga marina]MBL6447339.1 DUF1566 domain-containing protein [Fulvivirga marina]